MSHLSVEEFLTKMKELIRTGRRHFVARTRNGVSYLQHLADLGLTDVEEAWECVLELEAIHYHSGPSRDHGDAASGRVIWVFKTEINGIMAYIKLKDETVRRGCVCLSFHEDEP
ncbi:hypothetical protein WJ0W_007144 [Paenibacillus melissococcoides]|uniref:Type II toxin-antitoxin system MqsR family toxin n=1 Tax=Paenibacillus melissococcoides TaxID=2912268 RepID=A0ABM9G8Z6_9BACL|nr:hypothetical protein [Paenibacillus melissococcoides]CAH8248476.1 hypothetical protein WJ0W_007144 [Paenibacillus melissococcoides]CAH8722104.1 hypothetical protein HTL2_006696 [Paenibacillus melissococcoides]CAH8722132.1 hypothetical protein WDD9_006635 [Paenibacillus melissococcoides]